MRCIECAEITPGGAARCSPCVDELTTRERDARAGRMPDALVEVGCPTNLVLASHAVPQAVLDCWSSGRGTYLYGPPGRGKSCIAVHLIRDVLYEASRSAPIDSVDWWRVASFWRADALMQSIRRAFEGHGTEAEDAILADHALRAVVVLDDLGAEKISQWSAQTLASFLSHREARGLKRTIITSNLSLEDVEEAYGQWGGAIASRIAGLCDVIQIKGPDRRRSR